jgi:hypothetical protein
MAFLLSGWPWLDLNSGMRPPAFTSWDPYVAASSSCSRYPDWDFVPTSFGTDEGSGDVPSDDDSSDIELDNLWCIGS